MASRPAPIFETRRDQMLPRLEPIEIERVRRFGEAHSFAAGDRIYKVLAGDEPVMAPSLPEPARIP
jgi:thioredoxin reductase (NADPH)